MKVEGGHIQNITDFKNIFVLLINSKSLSVNLQTLGKSCLYFSPVFWNTLYFDAGENVGKKGIVTSVTEEDDALYEPKYDGLQELLAQGDG